MFDLFRPHHAVTRLEDLDCTMLAARGIRGVMLDLDNTLTPWRDQIISPAVETWVEALRDTGLRACMVTNAVNARRVQPVADQLGLPWVTRAIKPLGGGFRRGMNLLDTTPDTTAMVGDMLLTDILGGNRLGIYTVLVDPISPREAWHARYIQRPVEQLIGRVPRQTASRC